MRLERTRHRSARDRMHHRRFDFDETTAIEEAAHFHNNPGALDEYFAHAFIRDQVEISLPVAQIHISQAMPLFRKRQKRLRQQFDTLDPYGEFVGLGPKQSAGHADDVSEIERTEKLKDLWTDYVKLDVELEPLALTKNMGKSGLSVRAKRNNPAGDPDV